MADNILLLIESDILPGKEAELRSVVADLKQHVTSTEPGTLRYDWFINTDTKTIRLIEEYDSMQSAIFHGGNYKAFRLRLDELRLVTRRTVCGNLSDEAKAMLAPMEPEFFEGM
jgi:quinol monooxygenase YgiN